MKIDLESYQYHEGDNLRENVGSATVNALKEQVGGNHYSKMKIQPAQFINENGLQFAEGNAIKYICRHSAKGKRKDIEKAIHYLEMILERDYD